LVSFVSQSPCAQSGVNSIGFKPYVMPAEALRLHDAPSCNTPIEALSMSRSASRSADSAACRATSWSLWLRAMFSASIDCRAVQTPMPVMAIRNSMTTTNATPRSCAFAAPCALGTGFTKYRMARILVILFHIIAQTEFFNMPGDGVAGGMVFLGTVAIAVCARCAWQARIAAKGARQQTNAHHGHISPKERGIAIDLCCRMTLHAPSLVDTVSKLQVFQSCDDGLVCCFIRCSMGAFAISAAHQALGADLLKQIGDSDIPERKAIRHKYGQLRGYGFIRRLRWGTAGVFLAFIVTGIAPCPGLTGGHNLASAVPALAGIASHGFGVAGEIVDDQGIRRVRIHRGAGAGCNVEFATIAAKNTRLERCGWPALGGVLPVGRYPWIGWQRGIGVVHALLGGVRKNRRHRGRIKPCIPDFMPQHLHHECAGFTAAAGSVDDPL